VYQSLNATATTPTWTNRSGTGNGALPDIPTATLARDLDNPTSTWYAGTDIGVFVTYNGGSTWLNATAPLGLPNIRVDKLEAVPGTRFLNAASYGRGMWRLELPASDGGVVFQNNATGQIVNWRTKNFVATGSVSLGFPGSIDWRIISGADLNGDGNDDLTWYNVSSGVLAYWLYNSGGTVTSTGVIATSPSGWVPFAASQPNSAAAVQTSIYWFNASTRTLAVWKLDSALNFASSVLTGVAPVGWNPRATGYADSDAIADVFWQGPGQEIVAWQLANSGSAISSSNLGVAGAGWNLVGAGKLSTLPDAALLFQNAGNVAAWQLSQGQVTSTHLIGVAPSGWSVRAAGLF
jgi:hypothetical protein